MRKYVCISGKKIKCMEGRSSHEISLCYNKRRRGGEVRGLEGKGVTLSCITYHITQYNMTQHVT